MKTRKKYEIIFITVGTTEFDELIQELDESYYQFEEVLYQLGCRKLIIQRGRGNYLLNNLEKNDKNRIHIEIYRFKPSLLEDMTKSHLIISHCGAGSILEALSLKKSLIVVVNNSLQGNHQDELSSALVERKYCISTTVEILLDTLKTYKNTDTIPFPQPNLELFPNLIDSLFASQ